jgi:hypothetical protein
MPSVPGFSPKPQSVIYRPSMYIEDADKRTKVRTTIVTRVNPDGSKTRFAMPTTRLPSANAKASTTEGLWGTDNSLWGDDSSMMGSLGVDLVARDAALQKWNQLEARRMALPPQIASQAQQWTISSNGRSMPARSGDLQSGSYTDSTVRLFGEQLVDYEKYLTTIEQAIAQGVPTEKLITQTVQVPVSAIPMPVYIGAGVLAVAVLGWLAFKD